MSDPETDRNAISKFEKQDIRGPPTHPYKALSIMKFIH